MLADAGFVLALGWQCLSTLAVEAAAAVEAAPREIAVEAVYYTKAHPSSDPAVEAAEAEDVASMRPASCR